MHIIDRPEVFFHRGHPVRTVFGRVAVTDALSALFDLTPKTSGKVLAELIKQYPELQDHLVPVRIKHDGPAFMTADYMTFLYMSDRVRHETFGYMDLMDQLFKTLVYRGINEAYAFVEPTCPGPK